MMIKIDIYKDCLEKIKENLFSEKRLVIESNAFDKNVLLDFNTLEQNITNSNMNILVMGQFGCGKSTFINALLGERILAESPVPTTALITEVHYGSEKKIVMYPYKGKWIGGDEPFEIEPSVEAIKRYSSINSNIVLDTNEDNTIASCFEKMVIYLPNEMLKQGIVIIDTPGIDTPGIIEEWSMDELLESYVPKSDAIVYCMSSIMPFTQTDVIRLNRLKSIGFTPIIVNTFYELLNENEKQKFIKCVNDWAIKYSPVEYCHYVDSKMCLEAKIEHRQSKYVESGFCELEAFLSKYLVKYKSREKIGTIINYIKDFNNSLIEKIEPQNMNGIDATQFEKYTIEKYSKEVYEFKSNLYEEISFLQREIYNKADFDVTISIFNVLRNGEKVITEYENNVNKIIINWLDDVLFVKVLDVFKDIYNEIKLYCQNTIFEELTNVYGIKSYGNLHINCTFPPTAAALIWSEIVRRRYNAEQMRKASLSKMREKLPEVLKPQTDKIVEWCDELFEHGKKLLREALETRGIIVLNAKEFLIQTNKQLENIREKLDN